jgi:thiosulfate/3-mercaptopyruvate sulfurtransferase
MVRSLLRTGLLLAVAASPTPAQLPTGPQLLVTAKWLNQHLHDQDLVILVVGPGGAYPAGHIPGSQAIRTADIHTPPTRDPAVLALEMLPPAELRPRLEKFGISNASRIVVVPDSEWDSPSTRVALTLGYAGLGDRTYFLDGGMTAWRAANYPVTTDVPAIKPGTLTTAAVPSVIVDANYLTAHRDAPHVKLIDAREANSYSQAARNTRLAGHIPGAASLPYLSLIQDSTDLFLPRAELEQRFRAVGVQPGDTVVPYCHVGQYATVVLFAARLLGHPAKLYDGSFQDWSMRQLPTEGGQQ